MNDVDSGTFVTDSTGSGLIITIAKLPPGDYAIDVTSQFGVTKTIHISVRSLATLYAALADIFERMDADIADIDAARELERVTETYIAVYGKQVRQQQPSNFRLEEYRTLLRQLRSAYRHFGGHPAGLQYAVQALTSVTPFVVPKAWRPKIVLGTKKYSDDLQQRSRDSAVVYMPSLLANLNRQPLVWVHPSVGTSLVITGLRQPPFAQPLAVSFGSSGSSCTVTGLDESGAVVVEVIPNPSVTATASTYVGQVNFARIISAQVTVGTASVGLRKSNFIAFPTDLPPFNSYNVLGSSNLSYAGLNASMLPKLSWSGGPTTLAPAQFVAGHGNGLNDSISSPSGGAQTLFVADGLFTPDMDSRALTISGAVEQYNNGIFSIIQVISPQSVRYSNSNSLLARNDRTFGGSYSVQQPAVEVTLAGPSTVASIYGTFETSGSFTTAVDAHAEHNQDRLSLNIDKLGPIIIALGSGGTPATVAGTINTALAADTRYAAYGSAASTITGTDGNTIIVISGLVTGSGGSVEIIPVSCDAQDRVLRLPRSSARLNADASGTSLTCVSTAWMPTAFSARIRGLKLPVTAGAGTLSTTSMTPGSTMSCQLTLTSGSFTGSNVGDSVRWTDGVHPTQNSGIHLIVSVTSGVATLRHEQNGQLFNLAASTTGAGAIYGKGEIVSVTVNDKTSHVLTLEAAPAISWRANAIIEVVSETPYQILGATGLATVEAVVDTSFRPYHDFGDRLTFANSTDATAGMTLTCSRGLFTGVTGTIAIQGCQMLTNNGTSFAITSVTTNSVTFTNLNGVQETSNFEWSVNVPPTATDVVTTVGNNIPNGWNTNAATVSDDGTIGQALLVPSKVMFTNTTTTTVTSPSVDISAYRGLPLTAAFWLQEHTSVAGYSLSVAFDGGSSHVVSSVTSPNPAILETSNPFVFTGRFFVPALATNMRLTLTRALGGDTTSIFSVERLIVRSETGTGFGLGDNTVLRSQKRATFGRLLYVWSAEDLTAEEDAFLGLDPNELISVPCDLETI